MNESGDLNPDVVAPPEVGRELARKLYEVRAPAGGGGRRRVSRGRS
jgi:hypothetical protein